MVEGIVVPEPAREVKVLVALHSAPARAVSRSSQSFAQRKEWIPMCWALERPNPLPSLDGVIEASGLQSAPWQTCHSLQEGSQGAVSHTDETPPFPGFETRRLAVEDLLLGVPGPVPSEILGVPSQARALLPGRWGRTCL